MTRSLRCLVALLLIVFPSCSGKHEPVAEEARSVPVHSTLPEFSFSNQEGRAFGSADLDGKVWIADFIFTRCVATCPMQTVEKVKLQDALAGLEGAGRVAMATFSVEPEHDTPEVLAEYARVHGADTSRWNFLTGERGDLWSLSANGFKMAVAEDAKNVQMPILHSSRFVLVDSGRRIRGYYDGLSPEGRGELMADLKRVLAEQQPSADSGERHRFEKFPYPAEIIDPPWLAARAEKQIAAGDQIAAFHGFSFSDVVEQSGITFKHRIVADSGKDYKPVHYDHGNGVSVADVDGDGLTDLYFTTQLGRNQLWRNLGDAKFENVTTPDIAMADKISVAASFGDTDNDGDPDLFVTTVRGGNFFFENDGSGAFSDKTKSAGLGHVGHSSSGVFFDYDRDGLLDLFVCNVGVFSTDEIGPGGYCIGLADAFMGHMRPDERNERSILYHNLGGNRFKDVSLKTGLFDESWTGDACPVDYNEDGWIDLYVLSMQGHDRLYRNVGGDRFTTDPGVVFPKTPWGAMGVCVLDYDNDGHQDIYITDMHSDMSGEVGPEHEDIKSHMHWGEEMLRSGGRSIFGNAFYRALGGGKFEEISDEIGVENYWPWGVSGGDLNADGFVDVFVTASMNFPFRYSPNRLLLNDGGKTFASAEFILGAEPRRGERTAKPWFELDPTGEDKDSPINEKLGAGEPVEVWGSLGSRGSAIFDLDNDGDLDIVTAEFNDGPMVLRSDLSEMQEIRWLKVVTQGAASNRDGLGAVVSVTTGGKAFRKVQDGCTGYLAHGLLPLYFGLGDESAPISVEVTWPSGVVSLLEGARSNTVVTVLEKAPGE